MNDKEMIELTGMSIAELDTAVEVALSAEVDEYVKTIQWSDDTDQSTKTLIIGNIRGFALRTTSPKSPINHLLNRLSHDFATATANIEALEAKLAASEGLCDAEVFAVVYSNYDPLEIDSLWATEQLAMEHRERLNDSMWTVVRMTVHSTPYTADEEDTDA